MQCDNCRLTSACQNGHIAFVGWDGDGREATESKICPCDCHYFDDSELLKELFDIGGES